MLLKSLASGTALVGLVLLSACGGQEDTREPAAATDTSTVETAAAPEAVGEVSPADETGIAEASAPNETEAGAADMAEGEDHDHEVEQDQGDAHDHGDDHGDAHEHAGGTAHVHGHAEAAIVLDGGALTISIDSALASFGASEAEPETTEEQTERDLLRVALSQPGGLVSLPEAARCIFSGADVMFHYPGAHGNAEASYSWQCSRPEALDSVTFTAFETYETLEEIEVVGLIGTAQTAATLNPASPRFSID